jgi:hypothetical protein
MTSLKRLDEQLLIGLAPGTWAAVSSDQGKLVGTGQTVEQALNAAKAVWRGQAILGSSSFGELKLSYFERLSLRKGCIGPLSGSVYFISDTVPEAHRTAFLTGSASSNLSTDCSGSPRLSRASVGSVCDPRLRCRPMFCFQASSLDFSVLIRRAQGSRRFREWVPSIRYRHFSITSE